MPDEVQQPNNRVRSNIPVPDPSLLTAEQFNRERAAIEDRLKTEITHLRELVETQIKDLASELSRFTTGHAEKHRDVVEAAVTHLREVDDEKFRNVDQRFIERDARMAESTQAAKDAIAAALAAVKEASTKSEASFDKQIQNLETLVNSQNKAREEQIRNLERTVDKAEGGIVGAKEQKAETVVEKTGINQQVLIAISVGSLLLATIVFVLSVTLPAK